MLPDSSLILLSLLGFISVLKLTSVVAAPEEENEDGRVLLSDTDDGDMEDNPQPPKSLDHMPPLTSAMEESLPSSSKFSTKSEPDNAPLFNTAECGYKKGCLFKPKGCIPHMNCSYAFSYRSDADRVYIELLGQVSSDANSFVAVGFSNDGLMGNDTVTDCSSFEGQPFTGRLSFNPGKTNRKVPIEDTMQDQMLTTHLAQFSDGAVYCRLSQRIIPAENLPSYYVRPLNQSYRIFLSSGLTESRQLTVHSLDPNSPRYPFVSNSAIRLTTFHQMGTFDFASSTGVDNNDQTNMNFVREALDEHQNIQITDDHFDDDDGNDGQIHRDDPVTSAPNSSQATAQMASDDAAQGMRFLRAHGKLSS